MEVFSWHTIHDFIIENAKGEESGGVSHEEESAAVKGFPSKLKECFLFILFIAS